MLTKSQASEIVQASIGITIGSKTIRKNIDLQESLSDAGITQDKLNALVITLVANPDIGVPRFQHYLDPNIIGDLRLDTTGAELVEKILTLSAGKLCSNPSTPHPQQWPYPARCLQCGYPVP